MAELASSARGTPTGNDVEDPQCIKLRRALQALEEGKPVDTLELGLLAGEYQGPSECQFTFEAESGLLHSYKNCRKYDNHDAFIPIKRFITLDCNCLPDGYKEPLLFEFIKLQAALTVMLKVSYVSEGRPDRHPRTGQPYMHGSFRGHSRIRWTGTGTVVKVEKEEATEGRHCPCAQCVSSGISHNGWFTFTIATARHVVYDQVEAEKTVAGFCIDTEQGEKQFQISQGTFLKVNSDAGLLLFTTHDNSHGEILSKCLKELQANRIEATQLFYKQKDKPLLAIVSHPHGLDKQVSFGFIKDEVVHTYKAYPDPLSSLPSLPNLLADTCNFYPHGVEYDTPTCQGSSGAFIFHKDTVFKYLTASIHEGYFPPGRNYSGDNTDLEEFLRDPALLPSKPAVHGRLKKYLTRVNDKNMNKPKDLSQDEKLFRDLRKTAQDLPPELEVEVARKLDNERAFEFRRSAYKIYRLCPAGTMSIFADCVKSAVAEMKTDPTPLLNRFHEIAALRDTFSERSDEFDMLTGGPVKNKSGCTEEQDKEALRAEKKKKVTAEYLVQEARFLQDLGAEIILGLVPYKGKEIESLKQLLQDPSNERNLYRLFNDQVNLKDSSDKNEVDAFIDEIWERDPSLLRKVFSFINSNQ